MNDPQFQTLLAACIDLGTGFPDGLVYIGGIAVYLHAINHEATASLAATTHDADLYISLADLADLRDLEELTPNRRLHKHQLVKKGFEFDVYTERQAHLRVPYDEVVAHSIAYDGVRVAALEHLLVLKLEAYKDRRGSSKGDKDAHDLIRIAAVAAQGERPFEARVAAPYLDDEHLELLAAVSKGSHALALADGNAVVAKRLRGHFDKMVTSLRRGIQRP
jgi:hypothetical protein